MISNVMDSYIKYTQKQITQYIRLILKSKYDKDISNEFLETYINVRYLNYEQSDERLFYKKVNKALEEKKAELEKKYPYDKKIIENIFEIYDYIIYIDNVRKIRDLDEFLQNMFQGSNEDNDVEKSNIKINEETRKILSETIKEDIIKKQNFLEDFKTKDFALRLTKLRNNVFNTSLKYNFKMPYVYSKEGLKDIFNGKNIYEDKLMIQYVLVAILSVEDIINGNFKSQYIVDFATSLLKKDKKLKQLLNIVNNQVMQEKIKFKINYNRFRENKEYIYNLMREGFEFVMYVDNDFNITDEDIKQFKIFKYVLISKKNIYADDILKEHAEIENIIICE